MQTAIPAACVLNLILGVQRDVTVFGSKLQRRAFEVGSTCSRVSARLEASLTFRRHVVLLHHVRMRATLALVRARALPLLRERPFEFAEGPPAIFGRFRQIHSHEVDVDCSSSSP
jgi:hypothetical protein